MAALPALQRRRRFPRLAPVETSDATNWRDTACSHLSTTRWRAETNKLHAMLKKAQGEMGRKGEEMSKLRAQNITWSSDNKQRRAEAGTLV